MIRLVPFMLLGRLSIGAPSLRPQTRRVLKPGTLRVVTSLVVCVLVLIGFELIARRLFANVFYHVDHWDKNSASQFEHYRREAIVGRTPDVLIVGDSTGARGLDPEALATNMPAGTKVYNLATPANFATAFRYSTLPLLKSPYAPPRLLVVSLSPFAFTNYDAVRELEDQILNSPRCRRERLTTDLTAYLYLPRSLHLAELRSQNPDDSAEVALNGFHPLDGFEGNQPVIVKHPIRSDVQVSLAWKQPEADSNLAKQGTYLNADRLRLVADVVNVAHDRGFGVVFLSPCTLNLCLYGESSPEGNEYVREVLKFGNQPHVHVLDCADLPLLELEDYFDAAHLNRIGAKKFSTQISPLIASALAETSR